MTTDFENTILRNISQALKQQFFYTVKKKLVYTMNSLTNVKPFID